MADMKSPRKPNPAIEARDREMARLRNETPPLSLKAIGLLFPNEQGVPMTKEGVRVALARAAARGVEVKSVRGRTSGHTNKHTEQAVLRRDEARELFLGGLDEDDIIERMRVCEKTLKSYLKGLPEYEASRKTARRKPLRSALSDDEIGKLRHEDGLKIREISTLAGVTPSRISQVLQRLGNYTPKPETAERIQQVMGLLDDGLDVRGVAAEVGKSPSQVYAYRALGEVLASRGPAEG